MEVHGSNFEALGVPCLFLGALWVAGLPRGGQNELIELPVQAAAPIYRDSVDSGGGGDKVIRPVAACDLQWHGSRGP